MFLWHPLQISKNFFRSDNLNILVVGLGLIGGFIAKTIKKTRKID